MRRPPKSIDEYLSACPPDHRAALQKLRETIQAIAPEAEECIAYDVPAFRVEEGWGERVIAGFASTLKGLSYYPFSGSTLKKLKRELAGYSQTKGALHFTPAKPLPKALVRKLIATRLAEKDPRMD